MSSTEMPPEQVTRFPSISNRDGTTVTLGKASRKAAVGDWFLHTHIREGYGPQRLDLRYRLGIADEKVLRVLGVMEM
ncbi:MAG: GlxA family transcriptional regulator, partial [Pseudomonadota bacterium]